MQHAEIIEHPEHRAAHLSRTEILDRVGQLATLPSTEYATKDGVATFYGVSRATVQTVVNRHREEFADAGARKISGKDLDSLKSQVNGGVGQSESPLQDVYHLVVWTRRAVLLLGMLLQRSEVARAVRAYLLSAEDYARDAVSHEAPETPAAADAGDRADVLADVIRDEIRSQVREFMATDAPAEPEPAPERPARLTSRETSSPDEILRDLTPSAEDFARITDRPLIDANGSDLRVGISERRRGMPYAGYYQARGRPEWVPVTETMAAFLRYAAEVGASGS